MRGLIAAAALLLLVSGCKYYVTPTQIQSGDTTTPPAGVSSLVTGVVATPVAPNNSAFVLQWTGGTAPYLVTTTHQATGAQQSHSPAYSGMVINPAAGAGTYTGSVNGVTTTVTLEG